jgi:hypothetical protein
MKRLLLTAAAIAALTGAANAECRVPPDLWKLSDYMFVQEMLRIQECTGRYIDLTVLIEVKHARERRKGGE